MFFFSLAVYAVCAWILPWWGIGMAAFCLGILHGGTRTNAVQTAGAAGLVWACLAFILDGHSHGLISRRMAGLFNLPAPALMFVLMFVIGAVTALLCFWSGALGARFYSDRSEAESDQPVPENA